MITPSVIEYTVSSSCPTYYKVFTDKSTAEYVDKNLQETQKIYDTLKKYYKFEEKSIDRKDYQFRSSESFILDEDGKLHGIEKWSSSTIYDMWDGRPPINNSSSKKTIGEEFINKYINRILNNIKDRIKTLEKIKECEDFPDIVDLAKKKIQEHNDDYRIIDDYFNKDFNKYFKELLNI